MSRVAVVGYGLAGRVFHAPLVEATPGLELAAVVTADAGRGAAAAAEHPGVAVTARLDDVLAGQRRVDVVIVATPNASHVPLARQAVDAGVAVVVDKPLAPTAAQARALLDAASAAGVGLTVFHQRRWDGEVRTLRRLLAEGALGRVHRVECRWERWRPEVRSGAWREDPDPRAGGGLLADLGSHLVDQALWLWGPVRSVYAEVDTRRPGARVDDDTFVALDHAGGVRTHLWVSSVAASPGPRLRVLGDRAGWATTGLDVQEDQLRHGLGPGAPGWGVGDGGVLDDGDGPRPVEPEPGAWQDFYTGLTAALDGGAPMPVDPADAVAVLDVLDAARRSADRRQVVSC